MNPFIVITKNKCFMAMEFKGTDTLWLMNPELLKNEYGVKYLTIDFPEKSHAHCIDIYDGEISNEVELKANALLVSKSLKMLRLLDKVCSELYRLDNEMATEVKALIIEATSVE